MVASSSYSYLIRSANPELPLRCTIKDSIIIIDRDTSSWHNSGGVWVACSAGPIICIPKLLCGEKHIHLAGKYRLFNMLHGRCYRGGYRDIYSEGINEIGLIYLSCSMVASKLAVRKLMCNNLIEPGFIAVD